MHASFLHAIELRCLYLVQETCTRKKLVQETVTDVQVSCAGRLVQDSWTSFLTVCHQHKPSGQHRLPYPVWIRNWKMWRLVCFCDISHPPHDSRIQPCQQCKNASLCASIGKQDTCTLAARTCKLLGQLLVSESMQWQRSLPGFDAVLSLHKSRSVKSS